MEIQYDNDTLHQIELPPEELEPIQESDKVISGLQLRKLLDTPNTERQILEKAYIDDLEIILPTEWKSHTKLYTLFKEEGMNMFIYDKNDWGLKVEPVHLRTSGPVPYTTNIPKPRCSQKNYNIFVKEMERQIELGFYIKKESPYLSPMQVEDKDTEPYIRPVVDYSKTINPYLIPEHYPSAQPIDQIQRYGHYKILFELDWARSYRQIPISENSSRLLGMNGPNGPLLPCYIPEGVKTGGEYLQKFATEGFDIPDLRSNVCVKLDGILGGGNTLDEIYEVMKKIFKRGELFNFKLALHKCNFGTKNLSYYGYEITKDGFRLSDKRIQSILQIPFPNSMDANENKSAVRSFLGTLNIFRTNVPHYSKIAAPLFELIRNESKYIQVMSEPLYDFDNNMI